MRHAARRTMPARGRMAHSLPGAPADRQAAPVVPVPTRVPPAVRWAAALRPRAESGLPRGAGPGFSPETVLV